MLPLILGILGYFVEFFSGILVCHYNPLRMFCKFKMVCFYLKVISCLLLVRKFELSKKRSTF